MPHHLTPPQQLHHKRSFSNRTRQTISQAQHEFNYSRFSAVQSLKMAVYKLTTLVNHNHGTTNDLDDIRSAISTRPSTSYTTPQTTPPLSILEPDEYDRSVKFLPLFYLIVNFFISDTSTIHSCDQTQAATSGILSRGKPFAFSASCE